MTLPAQNSRASLGNASDYVVSITSINETLPAVNAIIKTLYACPLNNASNYVVAITSINSAYFVVNTKSPQRVAVWVIEGAREYVVTLTGIERAVIAKAVFSKTIGFVLITTIDYVVATKNISDASIEYLLHPDGGTISSWSVNVIFESSIAIGRPRLRNK